MKIPVSFSPSERTEWRRISKAMRAAGLDPSARASLLADFVLLESRIASLRASENAASGKARLAAARATNIATMERRRLHRELFRGAKVPKPTGPKPTTEELSAQEKQRQADDAWVEFLREHAGESQSPHLAALEAAM